jgi:hypothetical protein
MAFKFSRREQQCERCDCYYLNFEDQEVINAVQTECSHEYDCNSKEPCPIFISED